jgi:hypothetical protein
MIRVYSQRHWPGVGKGPLGPESGRPIPAERRRWPFEHLIDKSGDCWLWLGGRNSKKPTAYGRLYIGERPVLAHRFVYTLYRGPIPDGHSLDHLCRNRLCVNPAHLEPVSPRTNTMRSPIAPAAINARRTHCKNGHPFSDTNTRVVARGYRVCKACHGYALPESVRALGRPA